MGSSNNRLRALLVLMSGLFFVLAPLGQVTAQTCLTPPDGLMGWWPGDGNTKDLVNGNDGVMEGGVSYVEGKVAQAFSMDGTGYVQIPNDPEVLEPAQVTVDAWVRASTPGNYKYIVAKGANSCDDAASYALWTSPLGGLIFYVYDGTLGILYISPNAGEGIWDGEWHHVAGTCDGEYVRLYVDGSEVGSGHAFFPTIAIGYNLPDSNDLIIGNYIGNTDACNPNLDFDWHFAGDIDEVGVFNRALTQTEIDAIFDAGSKGKCKSPQAAIEQLVEQVAGLNLQQGIENGLDAKLDAAQRALDDLNQNNDAAACGSLEAFINEVEAQRGNKISDADADALISQAEQIVAMLCGG